MGCIFRGRLDPILVTNVPCAWIWTWSVWNALLQVHKGVHGFVQDKSGKAISKATIVLNEGLRVYTKEGGYFHVLLAPGLHNINAIADGYQQKHVKVRECPYPRSSPCSLSCKGIPVWALPSWLCLAADYVPRVAVFCLHIMDGEEFPCIAGLFWAVAFLSIALVFGICPVLPWSASICFVWTPNRGAGFETVWALTSFLCRSLYVMMHPALCSLYLILKTGYLVCQGSWL